MRNVLLASLGFVVSAMPAAAAELCFGPSINGMNVTIGCPPASNVLENGWLGYDTDGAPCNERFFWCHSPDPHWAISSSDVDPNANFGPLDGVGSLYLWFFCSPSADAIAAAEFDLVGAIPVVEFLPRNGFLNAGGATNLVLAVGGCPQGNVVVGEIVLGTATNAAAWVEADSFGRVKALYRR